MILRKKIKYIGATLTVVSFATVVWSRHATYTLPRCVTRPNIPIIFFWKHLFNRETEGKYISYEFPNCNVFENGCMYI